MPPLTPEQIQAIATRAPRPVCSVPKLITYVVLITVAERDALVAAAQPLRCGKCTCDSKFTALKQDDVCSRCYARLSDDYERLSDELERLTTPALKAEADAGRHNG